MPCDHINALIGLGFEVKLKMDHMPDDGQKKLAALDAAIACLRAQPAALASPQADNSPMVPDAAWEALQRMIEDGATRGPASKEDALLVARYRRRFFASYSAGVDAQGVRDEIQRLAQMADAAVFQDSADQHNILQVLAERLTALISSPVRECAQSKPVAVSDIHGDVHWCRGRMPGLSLYDRPQSMAEVQAAPAMSRDEQARANAYVAVCEVLESLDQGCMSRSPTPEQAAEVCALIRAAFTSAQTQSSTPGSPDDLRALGWAVAVHNDYRLNGEPHTFWLFTKGGRAVKGEGRTDAEALNEVRAALRATDE